MRALTLFTSLMRRYGLPLCVCITGALVLVIEIVATRVLAPYFGNTIYAVSSVIGVILGALSLGYYCGGRLSDKQPRLWLFFVLVLVSGFLVLFMDVMIAVALPICGFQFSLVSGPLMVSLILFFMPNVVLGMLSPFVVKLQQGLMPEIGVGTISGNVFFWSTVGSIAGSLLSGFVLIPRFGVMNILVVVSGILIGMGVVGLCGVYMRGRRLLLSGVMIVTGCGVVLVYSALAMERSANTVYEHDGVYEHIRVFDGVYREQPARFLVQDKSSSAAMYKNSDALVYDYTKYYQLYKLFQQSPERVLVLGGGAYSIPKAFLHDLPRAQVDVAEIEPLLVDVGKKYFRVPDDARLTTYMMDGRRLVHDRPATYDVIVSDVYHSFFAIPTHFVTKEFFVEAYAALRPGGVFIANIIGDLSPDNGGFGLSEIKTFRAVFPNSFFYAVDGFPADHVQNIMFVGYQGEGVTDIEKERARYPELSVLTQYMIDIDRLDLSPYRELTDDFAPVEYLIAPLIKNR